MRKSKMPFIPIERHETVRQQIKDVLKDRTLSTKELSAKVRVSEKDVYAHLDHIEKTANKEGCRIIITPAECRKCGFVFRKRERLKKPGKCPVCKSESIQEPLFLIECKKMY